MAGNCEVRITNVIDDQTIQTPSSPPYFQVSVYWKNVKTVDGTVSLVGAPGVTITPASYTAGQNSSGTVSFSLSAASSVTNVTLTAGLVVPSVPPINMSKSVTGVTVTVV